MLANEDAENFDSSNQPIQPIPDSKITEFICAVSPPLLEVDPEESQIVNTKNCIIVDNEEIKEPLLNKNDDQSGAANLNLSISNNELKSPETEHNNSEESMNNFTSYKMQLDETSTIDIDEYEELLKNCLSPDVKSVHECFVRELRQVKSIPS